MKNAYKLVLLLAVTVAISTSCKDKVEDPGPEDNFEVGDNHFVWDGKTFDLALFKWRSESYNSNTSLYKFDFVLNDADENHELYFEDIFTADSPYNGSFSYVSSADESGEFDWFGLDINQTGNTNDSVFHSSNSKWISGAVNIKTDHGYKIFEFSMIYEDARELNGYYALKL
ncbi:MAG: hypothetical protein JXR19_01710 [Bacteroidia bacterium]